jgi:hypothetical protein
VKLLKPYNPLAYPGNRLPGFDPSHPASQSSYFSAISSGANFVNLKNGRPGVISGAGFSTSVFGQIGSVTVGDTSVGKKSSFSGIPIVNQSRILMASIFYVAAIQGSTSMSVGCSTTTNGQGWYMYIPNNSPNLQAYNGAAVNSGIPMVANVPYFAAFSASVAANNVNFCLANLSNGTVKTGTAACGSVTTADGGCIVGGDSFGQTFVGGIAAFMFSNVYLGLPQLLAWAADPWSFWYPPVQQQVMFSGLQTGQQSSVTTTYQSTSDLFSPGLGRRFEPNLAFPASSVTSTVTAAQGTYTLTGEPQVFGIGLPASQGTYTLTGEAQTLNASRSITAVEGTYTLTGESTTLGVGMPASQGNYVLTGENQSLPVGLSTKPISGVYIQTGLSQALTYTPHGTSTTGGQWTEDELTEAYNTSWKYSKKIRQVLPRSINEAAVELGRKGGLARTKNMTPVQRSQLASHAAKSRWK